MISHYTILCNSCLAKCSGYTGLRHGLATFCDVCAVSDVYINNSTARVYFEIPESLYYWRQIIKYIKNKYMKEVFKLV